MVLRSSLLLIAALATFGWMAAGCSWAQESSEPAAADAAAETDATADAAADIAAEAATEPAAEEASEDDLQQLFGDLDDEEPTAAQEPAQNEAAATAADAKVHELTERVAALQTEVEELKATLYSLQQMIVSAQGAGEFSKRALGAMAEDADLRSQMGEMLQGKVRLVNNTGESVVLYINGTPWTVVTGESYVLAPVATVAFMNDPNGKPTFKGIQEWVENQDTGQFELEFVLGGEAEEADTTEKSVLESSE